MAEFDYVQDSIDNALSDANASTDPGMTGKAIVWALVAIAQAIREVAKAIAEAGRRG